MCAQEGSAPDHIHGKKVRCPGCKKVFRVQEAFVTETVSEGVVTCSKCGFAFSEIFTRKQDSSTLCNICIELSPAPA